MRAQGSIGRLAFDYYLKILEKCCRFMSHPLDGTYECLVSTSRFFLIFCYNETLAPELKVACREFDGDFENSSTHFICIINKLDIL